MNAKGFFKKIVAVTLAGTMIFGSAMVTMADSDSNNTQIVTQESALTNSQGFKLGKVYTGDQNVFDAKGEALPGYHWDSKKLTDYVEGCYDTKQDPICDKTEHEHSTYDGACYTKNTHGDKCYPYVEPVLATYEFQMKADENTTNGKRKFLLLFM